MRLRTRTKTNNGFTLFEILSIAFYILVEINVELFIHRPIYIAAVAFLFISFGVSNRIRLRSLPYLIWILLWASMTAFSLEYSIQKSYTTTAFLLIIGRGIALYLIVARTETKEELVCLLKIFVNVATVNMFYVATKVDVTTLGVSRIGANSIESDVSWNSNSIGITLAIASSAIILLLHNRQYINEKKLIAYMQLIFFVIVTMLSGSRVALFFMVGIPLLYYLLSSNIQTAWGNIIIAGIVLCITHWLLMNIPALYAVLGSRVERLIFTIQGKSVTDGSIYSRTELIECGMQWFREKPILGYGMYTFMALSGVYFSYEWYAHNNYVEILVGTGVVGFIVYYWYYARLLFKTITQKFNERKLIISIMIVVMISEYGVVAFKSFDFQFAIGIVTILFNIGTREMSTPNEG